RRMSCLSLALLGAPEVRRGGDLLSFPTRKTAALLIYLAVEGGLQTRDALTALLWPESDEARGRGALRSTLGFLRAALRDAAGGPEAHLVVERERLGVAADTIELDVQALAEAYALAREPARLPAVELVARLQAAVSSYRVDFLEGFSLPDAPAFDDWAATQRELWRRRMHRVFDRLARELFDGGGRLDAIELSERWVSFDPLSEAAHRRLMQVYVAAGDRPAALRAYQRCREVLQAELNAEPAEETEALAERIRAAAL